MRRFLVGGCVRDERLGIESKDIDFACEMPPEMRGGDPGIAFAAMRQELIEEGFHIHVETCERFTIRCGVPAGHPLRKISKDADFVMCRDEGPSSDGRHPDWVEVASLAEDQARRDFTMNSIAVDPLTHEVFDPFNGFDDIDKSIIRFVGRAEDRIREDGLRVMRGLRFMVTKGFELSFGTEAAIESPFAAAMLARESVSVERIADELAKMFQVDPIRSVEILGGLSVAHRQAIFRDPLSIAPTLRKNVAVQEID